MAISMYQASVPVFTQMLGALSGIFDKAEAHCEARKIDPAALLTARLYPDMHPLTGQVQIALDLTYNMVRRLAGIELPSRPEGAITSFAEAKQRIAAALDFLGGLDEKAFENSEAKPIEMQTPAATLKFRGDGYLLSFSLPNFLFHVTTAYDILRHNGLEIGKRDFVGRAQILG